MAKCKNCKSVFSPRFSSLERYCWNPECKTIEALQKLEKHKKTEASIQRKTQRTLKKEAIERLKTHSEWLQDLQKEVNRYVRKRDEGKPCISCSRILRGKYDAGHFFSVGSYPNLRFNLENIHGQCVHCNQHLHGNLIQYQINLEKRIGAEKMRELYDLRSVPLKISIPEIKEQIFMHKEMFKSFLTK